MDDWYRITQHEIQKWGGGGLLVMYYQGSPFRALQAIYPDHKWMPWRFGQAPKGTWDTIKSDVNEQKRVIQWLSEKLSVKYLEDWYRVSLSQIRKLAPMGGIQSIGMLGDLLQSVYPEFPWDLDLLTKKNHPSKASQRMVTVVLKELFPKDGRVSLFRAF